MSDAWRKSTYSGSQANCVEVSNTWRKSTYSGSEANCVEVSNTWRKSTYSGSQADCVEVGDATGLVKVRDSKDRQGPVITVSADAWRRFTAKIKG
jgi:Domain of unknown function (DUF397)